ncbi:T6SS effector BTH_I2691 family protein [Janthinobacterium sp. GMG2]|uniref:T6SS effector BTH_I2691 family protein n=1 Tax=Janthinobacterium sp. GMG2 TaxID=3096606 RepID=UPI0029F4AEF5|nr:T6SS effector BTH_I2691 family protein [Janthinobacterium sp. GMG2]MDX8124729.1 T6SS effector BTH_I2691 family protein [Janthinobacterium sp. GMG2]
MKDCKFCDKNGLFILPLRYAAVVGEGAAGSVPALPGKLGDKVKHIKLENASYAPRLLRSGFLYVLIKRSGLLYWEGYFADDDAFLSKFPVDTPPSAAVTFSCDRTTCGINASLISIDKIEFVEKIYLLFTPTAMTTDRLDAYAANPDARVGTGQMQVFLPKEWAAGSTEQPHSLKPEELGKYVPEAVLARQYQNACKSPLGKILMQQLYMASCDAYEGMANLPLATPGGRIGKLEEKMVATKAAAFAVFDPIGITQELNDFRNAALQPLEDFLGQVDKEKVSNRRKMDVMVGIDDIKDCVVKYGVEIRKKNLDDMDLRALPDINKNNAEMLRKLNRVKEAEIIEERIRKTSEAREKRREQILAGSEQDAREKFEKKYESLISVSEIDLLRKTLDKLSREAEAKSKKRTADHARWVISTELVDAFDSYDEENISSGFCFNFEYSRCVFGMFASTENAPVLKSWMDVNSIDRKNLYMRSNFYNHKSLYDAAEKAFKEAKDQVEAAGDISKVQAAPWLKACKGLIDSFKKIDSAWDEWLRDSGVLKIHNKDPSASTKKPIVNLSKYHRTAEGMAFAKISEWTQALSTKSGKLDKAISGVVGVLLYSKLADLAEKITFEELMVPLKQKNIDELREKSKKYAETLKTESKKNKLEQSIENKAERLARKEATRIAQADAAKVEGSIEKLIEDEQAKVKNKVKIALDELDVGKRPETNNFRHARMGVLLMSIESLSLATKLPHFQDSPRLKAEVAASIFSLSSITFDLIYAVTKSIREILPYSKINGINKAADIIRGGFKMAAGVLGAISGFIVVCLDILSAYDEIKKERSNGVLVGIYTSRAVFGAINMGLGLAAALSYGAPLLARLAGSQLAKNFSFSLKTINYFGGLAQSLVGGRTILLIRLARFNLIGLGITVVEVGYRVWIMDDELENWFQACSFRKERGWFSEKPFATVEQELMELQKALKAIQS